MRVVLVVASISAMTASPALAADQVTPRPDSPAGVVYEIPLDAARQDAAPKGALIQRTSARPTSRMNGSVQSENGYGSSAHVPGYAPRHVNAPSSAARPASGHAKAGDSGSTRDQPKEADPKQRTTTPRTFLWSLLVLALTALVGVASGLLSSRGPLPGR